MLSRNRASAHRPFAQIDLMYTVLTKSTGERCYYPNARMLQLPVVNLSRTALKGEAVNFTVDAGAPALMARQALLVGAAVGV
jgi:small-conductance mechanosensitive channel